MSGLDRGRNGILFIEDEREFYGDRHGPRYMLVPVAPEEIRQSTRGFVFHEGNWYREYRDPFDIRDD